MNAEILIVDDCGRNRLLLKRRLAELGYGEARMAGSGVEAMAAMAAHRFDVVLLDLEMPELDGIGVLERLRAMREAPAVIVIAAPTEMSGVMRCIALGAQDHLPRSCDPPLLAARLRTVLEHRRLRDLAAGRLAALEAEFESARRAQLSLVPRNFAALSRAAVTVAAHMEPARVVGGDFCDILPIGERHLMFLVADVAAKGASAGVTMARAFGLIRAAARLADAAGRVPDPAELLTVANQDLAADNPQMTFVTAALGVVDAASGEGRICIAGHQTPLLLGAAGARGMAGGKVQPALGVIEGMSYGSAPFALAPGEGLLLLSDGVTEAHDPDGALFGRQRLLAALGAETGPAPAIALLLRAVRGFARGEPQADDVTVLALRYAPG